MSALTAARVSPRTFHWTDRKLPLNGGSKAWSGGLACLDTSDGMVKPAAAATTLIPIGVFAEDVDNSAGSDGDKTVNVEFFVPVRGTWWNNDTGTAVVATDLGKDCYLLDDQTVTGDSTGHSKAGRVWGVAVKDGVNCVAVEHSRGGL